MKKWGIFAAPCLLMFSFSALADEVNNLALPSNAKSGLFIKFGGHHTPIKFGQYFNESGNSNSYNIDGLNLLPYSAGSSTNPYHSIQSTFAPEAQMGYFKHFKDSNKLWGVKFLYNYLGMASNDRDIDLPQTRVLTNSHASSSSSNNVLSSQTNVNHELALLAFIGQTFMNSHLYLGAGPSLFGVQPTSYGRRIEVGASEGFSNSRWLWGGAAQMGMTYNFNPTWFLDLSYTYAITGLSAIDYALPFSSLATNYADANDTYGNSVQRLSAQSFTLSVKKIFSLF